VITGEVAKIRMTGIPEKMRLNGDVDQIDLEDDQGLGEVAAFVYVPDIEILVYQKNRDAVSASAFSLYLQELGELESEVEFDFILEAEALQRLAEMDIIRRFELQIAAPNNSEIFRDLDLAPNTLAGLMGTSPSVKASFVFSMGHQREGSILNEEVSRICRRLYDRAFHNENRNEKIKLLVSGREEFGAETEVIDLFSDRMIESIDVDLGEQRVIPHNALTRAAREAWRNRSVELREMFQAE